MIRLLKPRQTKKLKSVTISEVSKPPKPLSPEPMLADVEVRYELVDNTVSYS